MTPTQSSPPTYLASSACPHCAAAAHEAVLGRARVAAAERRAAHLATTSQMRETVMAEALLAAPDAADLAALKARARADAEALHQIRATWWYRLFGGRMARRSDP